MHLIAVLGNLDMTLKVEKKVMKGWKKEASENAQLTLGHRQVGRVDRKGVKLGERSRKGSDPKL